MKKYINYRSKFGLETVSEMTINSFADRKELKRELKEYRINDQSGLYYISQRCCKSWN